MNQDELGEMPLYPVAVAVSGNLLREDVTEVDETYLVTVEVTIRKAGLAHQAEGPPRPYAVAQITGVSTEGWRLVKPE